LSSLSIEAFWQVVIGSSHFYKEEKYGESNGTRARNTGMFSPQATKGQRKSGHQKCGSCHPALAGQGTLSHDREGIQHVPVANVLLNRRDGMQIA